MASSNTKQKSVTLTSTPTYSVNLNDLHSHSFDSADAIIDTYSNFSVIGTSGSDTITLRDGDDTVNSGGGDDVITVQYSYSQVTSGNGNNHILFKDFYLDYSEGVTLSLQSRDTITAGNGNNTIDDKAGSDVIMLGDGNNVITAGTTIALNRDINGPLYAAAGETISAGNGNDKITIGQNVSYTSVSITLGSGNDTIKGDQISGVIKMGDGNDLIDASGIFNRFAKKHGASIIVGSGKDTIIGGIGADTIDASGGSLKGDSINGYGGNNFLIGGSGNDTISTGAGNSYLIGGAGNDDFVFYLPTASTQASAGNGYTESVLDFNGTLDAMNVSFGGVYHSLGVILNNTKLEGYFITTGSLSSPGLDSGLTHYVTLSDHKSFVETIKY